MARARRLGFEVSGEGGGSINRRIPELLSSGFRSDPPPLSLSLSPPSTVYNLCRCAGTNDAVAPTEIAWEFILPTLRRPSSNAKTWRSGREGGKAPLKNVKSCLCRIVLPPPPPPARFRASISLSASDLWKLASYRSPKGEVFKWEFSIRFHRNFN